MRTITKEQAEEIGTRIYDTSSNVFTVAADVTGWKPERGVECDAVYETVARVAELAKCMECNLWKGLSEMDGDICCECANE